MIVLETYIIYMKYKECVNECKIQEACKKKLFFFANKLLFSFINKSRLYSASHYIYVYVCNLTFNLAKNNLILIKY